MIDKLKYNFLFRHAIFMELEVEAADIMGKCAFYFVLCGIAFVLSSSLGAAKAADTPNLALNSFKAFLAGPPIITNLTYEMEYQLDGCGYPTNQPIYFQAKWQTNAYLLRQMTGLGDTNNYLQSDHSLLYINFDDRYCFLTPADSFRVWDNQRVPEDAKVHPYGFNKLGKILLSWLMNLGIGEIPIGSIVWSGDKFRGKNQERNAEVNGSVLELSNGLPCKIEYDFTDKASGITWSHLVLYQYENDNNMPPYIPAMVSVFLKFGNELEPSYTIRIHCLQTNADPEAEAAFDYSPFLAKTTRDILYFTNQAAYIKHPGQPVAVAPQKWTPKLGQ